MQYRNVRNEKGACVVNIGHMLGLDQEREELGEKPVSFRYGDPSFKYVYSFVCVYL